jgi:hypothetical protein
MALFVLPFCHSLVFFLLSLSLSLSLYLYISPSSSSLYLYISPSSVFPSLSVDTSIERGLLLHFLRIGQIRSCADIVKRERLCRARVFEIRFEGRDTIDKELDLMAHSKEAAKGEDE